MKYITQTKFNDNQSIYNANLLYYNMVYNSKFYLTMQNFTTWKLFFLQKLDQLKFRFALKIYNYFYSILIVVLEYQFKK